MITHARHRVHLETALRHLEAALDIRKRCCFSSCVGVSDDFVWTVADDVVLAAEELRYAASAVGKISGTIDVEDVLDVIFRDFCIGK